MEDQTYRIGIIIGSLRKDSYNRKVALEAIKSAPHELAPEIIEIGELPLYNEDLETDAPPPAWVKFRERVRSVDGLLFFTPEYNRTMPGALKNAIDVGSRPYGEAVFTGKPAGIISISIGAIGGFGANHALRQSLVFLNMPCMLQPEAYIGNISQSFDADGHLKGNVAGFLKAVLDSYADWVKLFSRSK